MVDLFWQTFMVVDEERSMPNSFAIPFFAVSNGFSRDQEKVQ